MISVVIPTYNESRALPATLARLFQQSGDFEVIVVDGGSSDDTRQLAARERRVRLLVACKGRASQMNAGAAAASGTWLLFLHADTLLPPDGLATIRDLDERIQAGCFRQRFSGNDWRLRLISNMHNLRCRWTRIMYGDQAMFVRRATFESLGGFPPQSILEDVLFSQELVRITRPVLLDRFVVTDARKFLQMGIWKSLGRVFLIMLCFELRLPLARLPARRFFSDIR